MVFRVFGTCLTQVRLGYFGNIVKFFQSGSNSHLFSKGDQREAGALVKAWEIF